METKNNDLTLENIKSSILSKEIEYQSSGIVSKQIIKKDNGNITLFAFDKGESLTEHTSAYDAFVYIEEGEMEIKIGGKPFTVKGGEFLILPANLPHGLIANEKSKMLLTMIK